MTWSILTNLTKQFDVQANKYGIKGYPTIKYFTPGKKDADSVHEYDGGRTSGDIVNWALDKFVDNIPAPEVIQIISENSLKAACEDKPLCIVSILPHILDCQSACRNEYLKILTSLGEKYKKKLWGCVSNSISGIFYLFYIFNAKYKLSIYGFELVYIC